MKRVTVMFSLIVFGVCGLAQSLAEDPDDPHWAQTWGDEFNGPSLNTYLWRPTYIWGSCSDQSALTSDGSNHLFQDGAIKLMTYEQNEDCFMWEGGTSPVVYSKPYTSGHIVSLSAFKYGYFEIRSRFPSNLPHLVVGTASGLPNPGFNPHPVIKTGEGFSPTFWLFPCYSDPTSGYVKYSEIDIYEVCGKTNQYTCNIHYSDADHYVLTEDGRYYSWWRFLQWNDYGFTINDGNFHTYAMKWDSLSIHFYFDGTPTFHYYHPDHPNDVFIPGNLLPMNIIVANSAYSGNFQDTISSNTILPYAYDIDYVRVSNLVCDNGTVVIDIPDFRQYYYAVKKSISMGSATVFPTDTTTYLHATDFIEMRPGFEVSGTSQVKMLIDQTCPSVHTFDYP